MDRLLFTKISYASGHGRAHRQKKVTLNGNEIKETIGPEKEEIFILHSTSIEVVLQLFPKSNHVFIIRKLHTPVLSRNKELLVRLTSEKHFRARLRNDHEVNFPDDDRSLFLLRLLYIQKNYLSEMLSPRHEKGVKDLCGRESLQRKPDARLLGIIPWGTICSQISP